MNNEQSKPMTDAEIAAFCQRMSKNPSPGFRSIGDDLSGHEAVMVTFGLRAAGMSTPAPVSEGADETDDTGPKTGVADTSEESAEGRRKTSPQKTPAS